MFTLILPQNATTSSNGKEYNIRPGAIEFIASLSESYDVVLYSSRKYQILEDIRTILDPDSKHIKQIICRKSCYLTSQKKFFKDLNLIKNRNIKDMVILDYKPQSFFPTLDNGILIPHWNGDEFDDQLNEEKVNFLLMLAKEHNIPFRIKARFRLYSILDIVIGKKKKRKKKVIIDFNKGKKTPHPIKLKEIQPEKIVSTPTTADVANSQGKH